jgi:hypothetical protein
MFTYDPGTELLQPRLRVRHMSGKLWLRKTTWGVCVLTNIAKEVPAGEVIEIRVAPLVGDRMVDVVWKDRTIRMFVEDLQVRCRVCCEAVTVPQNSGRARRAVA